MLNVLEIDKPKKKFMWKTFYLEKNISAKTWAREHRGRGHNLIQNHWEIFRRGLPTHFTHLSNDICNQMAVSSNNQRSIGLLPVATVLGGPLGTKANPPGRKRGKRKHSALLLSGSQEQLLLCNSVKCKRQRLMLMLKKQILNPVVKDWYRIFIEHKMPPPARLPKPGPKWGA